MKGKPAILLTRREFVRTSGALAAACAAPGVFALGQAKGAAALDTSALARFVDPLPIPQIARPSGTRANPENASEKLPYYRLAMGEFEARVHRDLGPTRQWGFQGSSPGPTIEARTGKGVLVEWANELPHGHLFTVDHNLHGAERDKPDVRSVVHLHGAKVRPDSDGYPENWFVPGKSAICHYPNRQDAAMLWYHDHAMGINRLNIYAGLLGAYIIRDEAEEALGLPSGEREIPLVFCDRALTADGQLRYEVSPDPSAPWVPEFYGDATLVNGKLFPYLNVQPALYRLRVLNGSNAQFFNLSLSNGSPIAQIGSDQGLLPGPVSAKSISLAPGERADLVVDFRNHGGEEIILNANQLQEALQFRVARGANQGAAALPAKLRPITRIAESEAARTRLLTLNEYKSPKGESMLMLLGGAHWDMPVTENPTLDTVEIWSFINLTEDVHPIHLHLARFQVLDRRPFDSFNYFVTGELRYTAAPLPPEPGEMGWKDTVRVQPDTVTRIIARFEGYPGRYVWHCHILEHEDNEMMRPFDVLPRGDPSKATKSLAG